MRRSMIGAIVLFTACATSTTERRHLPPVETVPRVDLQRYLGLWYEIATIPQRFQEGCSQTTAMYTLRDDGEIDVRNRCMKDGRLDEAKGRARVVDRTSNSKLEVSFFRPFWGEYWIVDLADDYSWAVVGHPSRDYLWILSRTPQLDPATYDGIVERLRAQGFPVERLQRTNQRATIEGTAPTESPPAED